MDHRIGSLYQHVVHRGRGERPLIERGEGVYLYDQAGKRYLDGASGAAVANLGHGVPAIADTIHAQALQVSYAAPTVFTHQSALDLGEAISERAPEGLRGNCRVWFSSTGTDAVDDAIRLARQYFVSVGYASKHRIIARWQSFHGNSIGMAGVHGHTRRRRLFSPMFIDAAHIPPAFCYRCPYGLTHPECDLRCARALEVEIRQQGPEGYFEIIRSICDKYGVLFIADEVMSGWGRTGRWFAIEAWGVNPDIIALGKGLGAGYTPVAATIAPDAIWDAVEADGPFNAGHTMNQNPVSCAVALAVIEYMQEHNLLNNAREVGETLQGQMEVLRRLEIVGDVRGMGLLCGVELVRDRETREPFEPALEASLRCQREALARGLFLYACTGSVDGVAGDMILIAPPLVITPAQVDEMMALMGAALNATQSAVST
jgi:adenosylmethionine-8-amino-7-oxononanoate aminotransferase